MQVLREVTAPIEFVPQILEANESDRQNGWMRVRGRFQMADTKNGNGRVYSSALWERVLGDRDLRQRVESRMMRGELEHPEDGRTNVSRVSHIVTGLERHGNEIIGEALILNTPAGQIVQELFRAKSPVGISSRGRGDSYTREGVEYVSEANFALDTFDFVDRPSTPGAYPQLVESKLAGPYSPEAPMDAKLAEVLKIQVRAHEMRALTESTTSRDKLTEQLAELTEAEERLRILRAQTGVSEEVKNAADKALGTVAESLAKVRASRVMAFDAEARRLDVRVEDAARGLTEGRGGQDGDLRELLRRSEELRTFYQESARDLAQRVEGSVDNQTWESALQLLETMTEQCAARDVALSETLAELEDLKAEHAASMGLVEAIVERSDEGRLLRRMREAMEDCPPLARFRAHFESAIERGCTLEDLDAMLAEHAAALREMGVGAVASGGVEPDDDEEQYDDSMEDGDDMDGGAVSACPECGAEEQAEPEGLECPECGAPIGAPDDADPAAEGDDLDDYGSADTPDDEGDPDDVGVAESPAVRQESELPSPGSVDAQRKDALTESADTRRGRKRLNESTSDPFANTANGVLNRLGWK